MQGGSKASTAVLRDMLAALNEKKKNPTPENRERVQIAWKRVMVSEWLGELEAPKYPIPFVPAPFVSLKRDAVAACRRFLDDPTDSRYAEAEQLYMGAWTAQMRAELEQDPEYADIPAFVKTRAIVAFNRYLEDPTPTHREQAEFQWRYVQDVRTAIVRAEREKRFLRRLWRLLKAIAAVDQSDYHFPNKLFQSVVAVSMGMLLVFAVFTIVQTLPSLSRVFMPLMDAGGGFFLPPGGAYPALVVAVASGIPLVVIGLVKLRHLSHNLAQVQLQPVTLLLCIGVFLFEIGRVLRMMLATLPEEPDMAFGVATHRATLVLTMLLAVLVLRIFQVSGGWQSYRSYFFNAGIAGLALVLALLIVLFPNAVLSSDTAQATLLNGLHTFPFVAPVRIVAAGSGWGSAVYNGVLLVAFFGYIPVITLVNFVQRLSLPMFIRLVVGWFFVLTTANDVAAFMGRSQWLLIDFGFLAVMGYATLLQVGVPHWLESEKLKRKNKNHNA